jgi:glucose-6-phosphate 1-dehydrogenase
MEAYERLLTDALEGDAELFSRQDIVEASWRVVDPILDGATPLYAYEPGSWGPPEADDLIVGDGRWHDPKPLG